MSVASRQIALTDENSTRQLASALAVACREGAVIYLHGDLGAGKTTFSRYLLQSLGHNGNVKSPTYTLVESYQLGALNIFHFDLYRLHDPEELEFMGIRDYFAASHLCLVEWPERGAPLLPQPDLDIQLTITSATGRQAVLQAQTAKGQAMLELIA
jgi:tRNA threonylcarbamoyladenosine biosynthesis protein TsaE